MTHEDGEPAHRAGVTAHALHHCEIIGLQRKSARSEGGYRVDGDGVVLRLPGAQALRERLGMMRRVPKRGRRAALDDGLACLSVVSDFEPSFSAAGRRRAFLALTRLGTGGSVRIMRSGVGATSQHRAP